MAEFSFKGRYTLREMDGTFYLYDREKGGLSDDVRFKPQRTFKKAEKELTRFKKEVEE